MLFRVPFLSPSELLTGGTLVNSLGEVLYESIALEQDNTVAELFYTEELTIEDDGTYYLYVRNSDNEVLHVQSILVEKGVLRNLPTEVESTILPITTNGDDITVLRYALGEDVDSVEEEDITELATNLYSVPSTLLDTTVSTYVRVVLVDEVPVRLFWFEPTVDRKCSFYLQILDRENEEGIEGVIVQIVNSADTVVAELVTGSSGKLSYLLDIDTYTLFYSKVGKVLSRELREIEITKHNTLSRQGVLVKEYLLEINKPTITDTDGIPDSSLATVTVTVRNLRGDPLVGVPISIQPYGTHISVSPLSVSSTALVQKTNSNGVTNFKVIKGVPFSIGADSYGSRLYPQGITADVAWSATGTATNYAPTSALPTLPRRTE